MIEQNTSQNASPSAPEADGLEPGLRRWAVLSLLLGTFLANLDTSIANVALPTITRAFSGTAAHAVWVVTAYHLTLAVMVLPLALLGEKFGFKRVFMLGVAIFTLSSVACAFAPSLSTLVAFRVLQGLGGACISTLVPALLRSIYPAKLMGSGVALLALTVATSNAFGPSVAAAILSVADWRWLFGVNIPMGIFVFFLTSRIVPRDEGRPRTFDAFGAIVNGIVLVLFIVGLGGLGDKLPLAIGELVVAAILAVVLIRHQLGHKAPLVPLDLLRIPILKFSSITSVCAYVTQTVALLALPFILGHQLHRSVSTIGLLLTPWPFVIIFMAPISGRLSDRYPAGVIGGVGLAVLAIGLSLLVALPADPSNLDIVWRILLCGIGFGLFQTPNNRIMLTSAPRERGGAAGGLMTMARVIGMTSGASMTTVMFDLYDVSGAWTALMLAAVWAWLAFAAGVVRWWQTGRRR
jgi:DHA2 family multidrug resistance protein-like MFS transporter